MKEQGACALWAIAGHTKPRQRQIAQGIGVTVIIQMLLEGSEKLQYIGKLTMYVPKLTMYVLCAYLPQYIGRSAIVCTVSINGIPAAVTRCRTETRIPSTVLFVNI